MTNSIRYTEYAVRILQPPVSNYLVVLQVGHVWKYLTHDSRRDLATVNWYASMAGPVFLEGETTTLRPIEEDDIEFIQRNMNDPRVWRPSLDINPMNNNLATEFFETVLTTEEDVHCLVCDGEEPLGHVSLTESQYGPDETSRARSAELAYWIAPEHQGQGHGSDAAATMIQYAFEDRNLRRIDARPGSFNDASCGLLESLGFEHEGTLREAAWYRGEYYDMLWYGLLRADWQTSR